MILQSITIYRFYSLTAKAAFLPAAGSRLSLESSRSHHGIEPCRRFLKPFFRKGKIPDDLRGILRGCVSQGALPGDCPQNSFSPLVNRCKVHVLQRFAGDPVAQAFAASVVCLTIFIVHKRKKLLSAYMTFCFCHLSAASCFFRFFFVCGPSDSAVFGSSLFTARRILLFPVLLCLQPAGSCCFRFFFVFNPSGSVPVRL